MTRKCTICRSMRVGQNVRLIKVPKPLEKRVKWNEACGVVLNKYALVCELHFRKDDFSSLPNKPNDKRLFLKEGVVPSLLLDQPGKVKLNEADSIRHVGVQTDPDFGYQGVPNQNGIDGTVLHLGRTLSINVTDFPKKRLQQSNLAAIGAKESRLHQMNMRDDQSSSSTLKDRSLTGPWDITDITVDDFTTPERTSRMIGFIQETFQKKGQELNTLQLEKRYLQNRILSLEKIISQSKEKNKINISQKASKQPEFATIVPSYMVTKTSVKIGDNTQLITPGCSKNEFVGCTSDDVIVKQEKFGIGDYGINLEFSAETPIKKELEYIYH